MFWSRVSISPESIGPARPVPISVVRSPETCTTSAVTTGQGAKFRPGSPVPTGLPNSSSTARSSGLTV